MHVTLSISILFTFTLLCIVCIGIYVLFCVCVYMCTNFEHLGGIILLFLHGLRVLLCIPIKRPLSPLQVFTVKRERDTERKWPAVGMRSDMTRCRWKQSCELAPLRLCYWGFPPSTEAPMPMDSSSSRDTIWRTRLTWVRYLGNSCWNRLYHTHHTHADIQAWYLYEPDGTWLATSGSVIISQTFDIWCPGPVQISRAFHKAPFSYLCILFYFYGSKSWHAITNVPKLHYSYFSYLGSNAGIVLFFFVCTDIICRTVPATD